MVFTNTKGRPIDNHNGDAWDRALKSAGIRHRPSYQLRHTFISKCIVAGHPLQYIAKLVGHSTIATLVRHYARWIESATAEQDEKLKKGFVLSVLEEKAESNTKPGVFPGVTTEPVRKPRRALRLLKNLETRGFEPLTSRVRSVRSTN